MRIHKSIPMEIASIFDPLGNAVHTALSWDMVGEDCLLYTSWGWFITTTAISTLWMVDGLIGILFQGILTFWGCLRTINHSCVMALHYLPLH